MKKTYYKMELRIGKWDYDNNKEILLVEFFYYSNGYIIIEDNYIKGFASNDLISGDINNTEIFIELLDYNKNEDYLSFVNEFYSTNIQFNVNYLIYGAEQEELLCMITFKKKINEVTEQQKILQYWEEVYKIHEIP